MFTSTPISIISVLKTTACTFTTLNTRCDEDEANPRYKTFEESDSRSAVTHVDATSMSPTPTPRKSLSGTFQAIKTQTKLKLSSIASKVRHFVGADDVRKDQIVSTDNGYSAGNKSKHHVT